MFSSEVLKFLAWLPDWLVAAVVLLVSVGLSLFAFRLARAAVHRAVKFEYPFVHALLQRAGGLLQFAVMLLAADMVTPVLPLDKSVEDALHRILTAAFVVLLGWIALLASDLAIDRYIGRFRIDVEDNLLARKAVTQMRVLKRTTEALISVLTLGFALMTFDTVRQYGISLFASAGVAGLAVGLAAKPLLSNLLAGVQIALTQPIRVEDVVVVEGEWGWIEEFTSTYVVVRIWDLRRLIVPLSYFLENPFQNWTRVSSSILGSAFFYLDYTAQIDRVRAKLEEIVKASKSWDGNVVNMQVTSISERTVEVRALMSARSSSLSWDLRCEVREKLLTYLRQEHPEALPRWRADVSEIQPRSQAG
ncbi:MAG: mechanosensitive ion channel family protein [Alphaproteobacteria bacterium]|nr:mechanosensitive ion channel family protein [Alphaproteobacteria bacterium]MDE2492737.1 mechanosensitive ion channel family protein [Alphaproteobacteria bacterium]